MMKKRIASTILALCLLLPMLPVSVRAAETPTSGKWGDLDWSLDRTSGILTISGTGMMGESVQRPRELTRLWEEIKSVTIEDGIVTIGDSAFKGFANLSKVTIPDSVTAIGEDAFNMCTSLTTITIPDSVNYIDNYAFSGSGLTEIEIPKGVLAIQRGTFLGCESLTNVTLPDSLMVIENSAFGGCAFETITIPNNVISIGDNVFSDCAQLTEIVIPDGAYLGGLVFKGCSKLKDITLPSDLTRIEYETFSGCTGLTTITIPESVEYLGESAFSGCTGLTSLEIPRSVREIKQKCFEGCTDLTTIKYNQAEWFAEKYFDEDFGVDPDKTTVTYLDGGKCGTRVYWTYNRDKNILSINSFYNPSAEGASMVTGPESAEDQAKWDSVLAKDPFICATTITGIKEGAFGSTFNAPIHIVESYYTPNTEKWPNKFDIHVLNTVPATTPECGKPWHGKGYECDKGDKCDQLDLVKSQFPLQEIDPLPHKLKDIDERPTCIKAGRKFGKVCDRCGEILIEGYETPAAGHQYGAWKITKEPTVEETGLKERECYFCKNKEEEIIPKIIPTTCTVIFDTQGGSAVKSQTVTNGGKVLKPEDPTKDKCTFVGWYKEAVCENPWDFDNDTVTENVTLYAKWEDSTVAPEKFTVTFNSQGGSVVSSQTIATGNKVSKPEDPTKDGCIFIGWYKEAACTIPWDFDNDTVTGNVILYAKWEDSTVAPSKFPVTFDLNYEGAPAPTVVPDIPINTKVTKPENPTRTGYTFGGWYKEAACENAWDFDTDTVTGITILYAKWTGDTEQDKTYTITFKLEYAGAKDITKTTGKDGKLADWPADPTRTDYTFDGWYTARLNGDKVSPDKEKVFDKDTILYAHWTKNSGTDDDTSYRIYTPGSVSGGSYDVSHRSAVRGTRVTIEFTPRSGYDLDYLTVTNRSTGEDVPLTERYSDEYYFTMPASSVDVDIAFYRERPGNVYFDAVPPQAKPGPTAWYYMNRHIWHVTDGMVPDSTPITRDMLVSVLYNLTDESLLNVPGTIGSETDSAHAWAVSNGVMPDIYASGLWGTDKSLSREQLALMVFQYARYRGRGTYQSMDLAYYADGGQVRPIAQEAVSWSLACGLLNPLAGTAIIPRGTITCGQTGELLYRYQTTIA